MKLTWVALLALISTTAQAALVRSHPSRSERVAARLTDLYDSGLSYIQSYESRVEGLKAQFAALRDSETYNDCFEDPHGLQRVLFWKMQEIRRRKLRNCGELADAMANQVGKLQTELVQAVQTAFDDKREALRDAARGSGRLQVIVADALQRFDRTLNLATYFAGTFSMSVSVGNFSCSQFAAGENLRKYRECITDSADSRIDYQAEFNRVNGTARVLSADRDAMLDRIHQAGH